VPYRKCHDALEGRIVAIMNKMVGGRNCQKDFEGLVEKMARITQKDMRNRFIVGGIRSIVTLAGDRNICEAKMLGRLQAEQRKLQ
jgi:hypothetical protein